MPDKSHKSAAEVRAALDLPPKGRRTRPATDGRVPQRREPALPTVDSPLGDAAGEIDDLFAIVQREGYHVAPGGYAVQFDDAGRPRVSLSVYPPSALDADHTDGHGNHTGEDDARPGGDTHTNDDDESGDVASDSPDGATDAPDDAPRGE